MDSSTGLDSSESELLLDISKIIFFVLCPISVLSSFFIIATYIIFRKEFSKILGSDFVLFLSICDFFLAAKLALQYILVGDLDVFDENYVVEKWSILLFVCLLTLFIVFLLFYWIQRKKTYSVKVYAFHSDTPLIFL
eukprot:TRINITY_DN2336_c0_g1_i2.p2 TRINITY_DN2336_c0_g1~~TRINITY_DN2336_c0_g1_i2.p2  ORF type:complete len:137 (+),score=18.08 TRINITY_DN2336_c0_g1_i2:337-747(+)